MKFFLDAESRPGIEETYIRPTPAYVELQKHSVDPPGISYIYLLFLDEHSLLVAACWLHQFDDWSSLLEDRKMGKHYFRLIKDTYPTVGQLLDNAVNARYSGGALINIEDPDDGERKWVIGTVVGNVAFRSEEEFMSLLDSERMMEAFVTVLGSSFVAVEEMTTRSIPWTSSARLFGHGFLQGYRDALPLSSVWISRLSNLVHE